MICSASLGSRNLGGRILGGRILGLVVMTFASVALAEPTTQPSVGSVASVLADMDQAYANLQSAQFDGHIIGHFDAAGQKTEQDFAFTSSFNAPNQFRHEVTEQNLLGSTGTTVYSYLKSRDEYQTGDAPKARVASGEWPAWVTGILQDQNPSLLLAMSASAGAELHALAKHITLESPTTIDGVAYDTLRLDVAADHQILTLVVDPVTHLLREAKFDLKNALEHAGTADVKQAEVTVDYTNVVPNAPVNIGHFAWTVPGGAILEAATNAVQAGGDNDLSDDLKGLLGKDAPDFSLQGLDDKAVKLSDLKGSVVILDFWATWCGPCVHSLPHLNDLYKEKSADGLKVLACNLQEDKDKVAAFVKKQGWTLPVILDTDGAVAGNYKASAIPETVVIGKDGKVKQIFVGSGHEEEIKKLVEDEMK